MRGKNKAELNSITKIKHCPRDKKPCYDKKGAVTAKNASQKFRGKQISIYHCTACNFWHLTHKGDTYTLYD